MGRPRKSSTTAKVKAKVQGVKTGRQPKRFGFNITKDIAILKAAVQFNPWQLGRDRWTEICTDVNAKYGWSLTERSVKDQVSRLVSRKKDNSLIAKTGTEEQKTERGQLIEDVIALIEEDESPIDEEFGAENDLSENSCDSSLPVFLRSDVQECTSPPPKKKSTNKTSTDKRGREQADKDRNDALEKMSKDMPPEQNSIRVKRGKLSLEDELIKTKQDHDMTVELKKMEFDDEKRRNQYELDKEKMDLERAKIALEIKREERLEVENKRRDELSASQLKFQESMCVFMQRMLEK